MARGVRGAARNSSTLPDGKPSPDPDEGSSECQNEDSMTIRDFIKETFQARSENAGALVIYDDQQRYREVVRGMAGENLTVIDATNSFIEAHEQAVERWS